MKPVELWERIALSGGHPITTSQAADLQRYRDWLETEAIPAGGLAPGEADRLDLRHIADSLLFLSEIQSPAAILDVGTGVGLPGIPLAIALPGSRFVLLDRSGRRVDLTKRAARVLGLENVQVEQGDFTHWRKQVPFIVSRATLPPPRFEKTLSRVLSPGGKAVIGGSWESRPEYPGYETKEIGSKVLDQPVWILIMHGT